MPVPRIKELSTELDFHPFRNASVFEQTDVVIVVAKSPQIGDARALTKVEIEAVRRLEGRTVE